MAIIIIAKIAIAIIIWTEMFPPCVPRDIESSEDICIKNISKIIKNGTRRDGLDFVMICTGAVISGAAIDMFLVPNQVVARGIAGLAILANHLTGLSVGAMLLLLILILPILRLGWRFAGGLRFFLFTLSGVAVLSLAIDLLAPLLPAPTTDRLPFSSFSGGGGPCSMDAGATPMNVGLSCT
jgi:uncharacterized membrane-anchored protein YitT (DUF2179 family)